jgi:hypothetical protein
VRKEQKREPAALRTAGDDQRRFSRFDVNIQAFVTAIPEPDTPDLMWYRRRTREKPAIVTDLSASGMRYISEQEQEKASQIWISLQIGEKTYPVRAMVRWKTSHMREGRAIYAHGVQFLKSDFAGPAIAAVVEFLESRIKKQQVKAA